MACQVRASILQSRLSIMKNEVYERLCITVTTCAMQNWSSEPSFNRQISKIGQKSAPFPKKRYILNFVDVYVVEKFLSSCGSMIMR